MKLDKSLSYKIEDMACELRTLRETDVTQNYINGLKEQKKTLLNIPGAIDIPQQQKYIKNIISSRDDTICGLYINGELVGTTGVQSSSSFLDDINDYSGNAAAIGILLFDKKYLGVGLGKALVWASTYLFHSTIPQIVWFGADMVKDNMPSLKSFLSCGFRIFDEDDILLKVALHFPELVKPSFISNVAIKKE